MKNYTVYYRKNSKNKIYYVIESGLCLVRNMLVSRPFLNLGNAKDSFQIHVNHEFEGKFKEIDQTQPVPAVSKRRS